MTICTVRSTRCTGRTLTEDAFLVVVGVTQEMIDETRLSTETRMLTDMKYLSEKGESLMYRGRSGETPVSLGETSLIGGDSGKSRGDVVNWGRLR